MNPLKHHNTLIEGMSENQVGYIDVRRQSEEDCKDRHVSVLMDGELLEHFHFGDRQVFPVPVGHHVLKASNTLNKIEIEFDISEGQTLYYECGQKANTMTYFLAGLLGSGWMTTFLEQTGPA